MWGVGFELANILALTVAFYLRQLLLRYKGFLYDNPRRPSLT